MANTCECGKCLAVVDCCDGITALALALEVAMACDADARARYKAIYGIAWGDDLPTATPTTKGNHTATKWSL